MFFSNDKVFDHINVKSILSLMSSCGMYDYSGEWTYSVGIPAKSGVSGCIYAVIPNKMGIAVYSPKLDKIGNSVKGVNFFREFSKVYAVHSFESVVSVNLKLPLTRENLFTKHFNTYMLLEASKQGDLHTLKQLLAKGVDVNSVDYDTRSALHLACSTGNIEITRVLLESKADVTVRDRWSNTPMDDAVRGKFDKIVRLLKGEEADLEAVPPSRIVDDHLSEV